MIEKYKEYDNLIKCLLLLFAFIILTFLIKKYFKPFIFIIILFFFTAPIYKKLDKLQIFNKRLNAFISIICVNVLLFLLLFFIGNFLIIKINTFINGDYINIANNIETLLKKNSVIANIINSNVNISNGHISLINSYILKKGAVYTTDGILAYIIGNIAAYFILIDKYVILNSISRFIPMKNLALIKNKMNDINNMINIELILVMITTFETIIGFWILNINNALILGVMCGVLDFLPYVGTIMIFIPLILYKVSIKKYSIVFGLLFLYILLIIIRQIMETKFISNKLKVHPLFIILSLYIGIKLFGIIGLFAGPIYVITAKEILL